MSEREEQALIESATTAWRPRSRNGGLRAHPAWHDLDDDGRRQAYQATCELRSMEAALDPDGLSTTARAVLRRIRGADWRNR
jgi:hypothetical protein